MLLLHSGFGVWSTDLPTTMGDHSMATYTIPARRYDHSAREPHISGRIMELHHDKHHAGYVQGANTALDRLAEAREKSRFEDIGALETALAFNLSGHVL